MSVVLARIDDRLVHGQVVVGWVRHLNANRIIVVSDRLAGDEKQRALFRLAAPPELKISTMTVKDAARVVLNREFEQDKIILLFPSPVEAEALIGEDVVLANINVGGLRYEEGKRQVLKAVSLSDTDREILRKIEARGIEVEARAASGDEKVDLHPYLI
jgi:mannose/fructose/sorbose-specific phosphotransferase system IIB component